MADTAEPTPTPRKSTARKAPAKKAAAPKTAKAAAPKRAAPKKAAAKSSTAGWRDQAEQIKVQAAKTARSAADVTKEKTGSAMHGLARLISDTAGTVDEKLGAQYGDYARYAAEAVEGAAKSLDAKDLDDIVTEAREFVRKSPAVAIGTAAVIGFVLMRITKGSGKSDEA